MFWKRFASRKPSELLSRATQLAAAGRHDKAIELLNQCIALQPDYVQALLTLVQILAYQHRYEEALEVCGRVLEIDPGNTPVRSSMEQILPTVLQSQRIDDVLEALDRCSAAKPDHVPTLLALSKVLTRAGRYRAALDICRRVLDVDSENGSAYDSIFEILSAPSQPEVAAHAQAVMPQIVEAYSSLFVPSGREKKFYEKVAAANVVDTLSFIITRFYHGLGLDPHSAPLSRFLQSTRERLGEVELGAYREVKSALVRFEIGWNRWLFGDMDEAMAVFGALLENAHAMKLAKHDPFTKEAFVRAGEILGRYEERIGNAEKALSIYRRILLLDDDGVIARHMLLLLWRKGRLREAAALAERAVSSRGNLFPGLPQSEYIASMRADLASYAAVRGAGEGANAG